MKQREKTCTLGSKTAKPFHGLGGGFVGRLRSWFCGQLCSFRYYYTYFFSTFHANSNGTSYRTTARSGFQQSDLSIAFDRKASARFPLFLSSSSVVTFSLPCSE